MIYNKQYFIDKFSAIPEGKWTRANLTSDEDPDCHCVLGHCGVITTQNGSYVRTEEATALEGLFDVLMRPEYSGRNDSAWRINDGCKHTLKSESLQEKIGESPKINVLAALNEIP